MQCRITELRCKEVINVHDGTRYGFVNDVLVDTGTGRVVAIVLPGPYRFWGMFGRNEDMIIPWESIKRIGEDIILVEHFGGCPEHGFECEKPRRQRGW